jgi:hypothetical protein
LAAEQHMAAAATPVGVAACRMVCAPLVGCNSWCVQSCWLQLSVCAALARLLAVERHSALRSAERRTWW